MGSGASSETKKKTRALSDPPPYRARVRMLVNGVARDGYPIRLKKGSKRDIVVDLSPTKKVRPHQHRANFTTDDDSYVMLRETDPATLQVLHLVNEADRLPLERAQLRLQMLRDCYPLLEQVPATHFDHLAVLVYQKEGDLYYALGDVENAKTTYSRAIQIAETHVARGEKEIYMVLKRYVLAMVGMSRLWFEQERNTTGFTLADKPAVEFLELMRKDSMSSTNSSRSSVLSDNSVFSLNQEILKSMAPREVRRRVGPTVSVVKLLRPSHCKVNYSIEDDFVLRSQMTRELKGSPCELLLLRCIEVVELGHRRQSELLIPALIELAHVYENLRLYNHSLLLVRRCLGILCNVYDYDHPWIVQLRSRGDYLMELMETKQRDTMATKIQATWKMYKAMLQLERTLGRPVIRHVWNPRAQDDLADTDFLRDFVNELPDGTVLYGTADAENLLLHSVDELQSPCSAQAESPSRQTAGSAGDAQRLHLDLEETPSSLRRKMRKMPKSTMHEYSISESHSPDLGNVDPNEDDTTYENDPSYENISAYDNDAYDEPYVVDGLQTRYSTEMQHGARQYNGDTRTQTTYIPNAHIVGTTQDTHTDAEVHETEYGGVLTIRTTTITRTVTGREVGSDEEDSVNADVSAADDERPGRLDLTQSNGTIKTLGAPNKDMQHRNGVPASSSLPMASNPAQGRYNTGYSNQSGTERGTESKYLAANSGWSSDPLPPIAQRSVSAMSGRSSAYRSESVTGSAKSSVQSQLESTRQMRSWRASNKSQEV